MCGMQQLWRESRDSNELHNYQMEAGELPTTTSWSARRRKRRRCGSVFALHKDDPAASEEREKSGEPLRVRPLGVGSVLVRLASAHALGQVAFRRAWY
eukprot:jgi/Tetstr1/463517/TSEL_008396.t1